MPSTELISQELGIPAVGIFPVSASATTLTTSYADMSKSGQLEFRLDVGVMTTTATLAFQLLGSTTNSGGAAIPGTSITNLVNVSPTNNSASTVTVLITAEKLLALGLNYRYVAGQVVASGAASLVCVSVREKDHNFSPAGASTNVPAPAYVNDASNIQQIQLFR